MCPGAVQPCAGIHPDSRAGGGHEHVAGDAGADPRAGTDWPSKHTPERVIADKGYPSRANRAWLREHGIATTIPERDDQITHRHKRPGRPIDFGDDQKVRYRGRNVVERCFNKLKQWRGIAMRSDKTARNYDAGLCLAATLHWLAPALEYALRASV